MANPRRTRYVAPNIVSPDRFGTRIRDPENNRLLSGEVNAQGQPLGTPQPFATGPDPFARRPPMATGATAVTPRTVAPNPAPRVATPPRDYGVAAATAALTPGAAFKPQPLAYSPPAPVSSSPTPTPAPIPTGAPSAPPRLVTPALPTNPDDMALLRETRARDAAARAPEPISIPGGLTGHAMRPGEDPLHPGQDSREGQALTAAVNRANGVAPTAPAPGAPIPQLLAAAGTNRDVRTPYGIVSSTTAREIASRTPLPVPAAATAAPPQGIPRAQPDYITPAAPPVAPPSLTDPLSQPIATDSPARRAPAAPSVAPIENTAAPDLGDRIRSAANTGMRAIGMAPDFPAYGPGSRPGGTGGVSSPMPAGMAMPGPASDFPNAGLTGGRFGGTGTQPIRAPQLTAPTTPTTPASNGPADSSLASGMDWLSRQKSATPPLLTGPLPRKKATPLDEPANQYN